MMWLQFKPKKTQEKSFINPLTNMFPPAASSLATAQRPGGLHLWPSSVRRIYHNQHVNAGPNTPGHSDLDLWPPSLHVLVKEISENKIEPHVCVLLDDTW